MKNALLLFALIPLILFSATNTPIGPRSAALGHASSCLSDIWSINNNQGSLGFLRANEAGAFYENRFLLKALTQTGFAVILPVKKGTFGLCYTSFGYKLYCQSHTTLSYGLKLNQAIGVGVGFNYSTIKLAENYGQTHTLTGSLGITAKILPQVIISTHINNPFGSNLSYYKRGDYPTTIKFGAQYLFSKKVFMVVEAEKSSTQKTNIKGGIEYNHASLIYLRVGAASYPSQVSFGMGVNYNGLKLDLSSSYQSVLGFVPQIGMYYVFGNSKTNSSISDALNN